MDTHETLTVSYTYTITSCECILILCGEYIGEMVISNSIHIIFMFMITLRMLSSGFDESTMRSW